MDINNQDTDNICPTKKLLSKLPFGKEDKTRVPRQERGIKTKTQIIEASMKLFSAKGYHKTTSKEIAAEAGVATGCFYSYFEDKRAVFIEALKIYNQQFNNKLFTQLEKIKDCKNDRRGYLLGVINGVLDAHEVYTEFHNELVVMKFSDPEAKKIMVDQSRTSIKTIQHYLEHWQGDLKVKDLEVASILIYNSIHKTVDTIIYDQTGIDAERIKDGLAEMILNYLF